MKLTHHPEQGWTFDPDRQYQQVRGMKPTGLWLSVDDDWRRWCRDEELDWADRAPDVPFEIVDPSRILALTTAEDLDMFSEKFIDLFADHYYVEWELLTQHFAGILIAPYQWSRRLHFKTSWYYTWDCASACIWDLSVVRQVALEAAS